jgi:hypothetical protein
LYAADTAPSVSVTLKAILRVSTATVVGVTTLLPLVEEVVTVVSADQAVQLVPLVDVQC